MNSTELLLKCVGDLISENVGKPIPLDLSEIIDQLELMYPEEFKRDEIEWDLWEDLVNDLFRTMKRSLINRN